MQQRTFFVALGVPRGAEPETFRVAYRKVITRYRQVLEGEAEPLDDPTVPPARFAVLRSYSERRHGSLFDRRDPAAPQPTSEVDRYFGGLVPEVEEQPIRARARRAGKDLYVELRLDPEQARRGGIFHVHIPVVRPCPKCAGETEESLLACRACGGVGRVTADRTVDVTAPPGVEHGRVARVAMEDVGLEETDLVVAVIVG